MLVRQLYYTYILHRKITLGSGYTFKKKKKKRVDNFTLQELSRTQRKFSCFLHFSNGKVHKMLLDLRSKR